jgi:hypothetical protein
MARSNQSSNTGGGVGVLFLLALVGYGAYAVWNSAFDCFLADEFNYVTAQCALIHLQKPACNDERDILGVDEVTDVSITDDKGQRDEVRKVIYKFRKRPTSGPVSDDVLRDTATIFKIKDGRWLASCENPTPKGN